jgi:hypothetical protein
VFFKIDKYKLIFLKEKNSEGIKEKNIGQIKKKRACLKGVILSRSNPDNIDRIKIIQNGMVKNNILRLNDLRFLETTEYKSVLTQSRIIKKLERLSFNIGNRNSSEIKKGNSL